MKLYSTNNKNNIVGLKEALLKGLADDGGLFMPMEISELKGELSGTFQEIAFAAAKCLLQNEVPDDKLKEIIDDAINFDAPLVKICEGVSALELFHGPTLAFKDFGARFLSRIISFFIKGEGREITVLAATSGDTGSAVAHGFFNVPGIKVVLLYPSGKVSKIQEQQLTTMGGNVTALEVNGTFDDCQRLVKQAFQDKELSEKFGLASANSINIGRLIPQMFYYFYAYSQIKDKSKPVVFSIPCGNFGNLTAGLIAKKMGLPVARFIAATNANNIFGEYMEKGVFKPKSSIETISNAMDVGNPSNFARIMALYENNREELKKDVWTKSFSDEETKAAIKEVYEKYNYLMDPHGAVAYLGLKKYQKENPDCEGVFFITAHPAKFADVVESIIGKKIDTPERLQEYMDREKKSYKIGANFEELKESLGKL